MFIGSGNLYSRKASYWSQLRAGKHKNVSLQKEWDKFGEDNFKFITLFQCEDTPDFSFLIECEKHWLSLTNATQKAYGYNIDKYTNKNKAFVLRLNTPRKLRNNKKTST